MRRHIPSVLALLPTQRSMDVLLATLDDPDGFLRYKAIAAIEKLRRDHPDLILAREPIEALVLKESARYYEYLTLRFNLLQRNADAQKSLLVRALDDKLDRTLDRIYRLLGLIYPWKDIAAARYTIEHGDGRKRAAAIEYIDNLLGGADSQERDADYRRLPDGGKGAARPPHAQDRAGRSRADRLAARARRRSSRRCGRYPFRRTAPAVVALQRPRTLAGAPAGADWYVFEAASWALAPTGFGEAARSLDGAAAGGRAG